MIEIGLEPRACECCGGNDLEPVWSNQSVVRRAASTWLFPVRVVVCPRCGFCFASPGPSREDLKRYHADGLSGYKGIGLPYLVERRLSLLERYRAPSGVFAEVGGDQPGEFHRRCAGLFAKMVNIEVSEDTPADYRSVEELPTESVDVLAHYDVLEHIPNVRDFMKACHRALKKNGVMVCEMPDVRLYPRNLLLFEFEHVNHFSVATLSAIGQACGLKLIEAGHICSRPYGFVSVLCKDILRTDLPITGPFEYVDTLACVRGGIEQIQCVLTQIKSLQSRITGLGALGKKITLWGVTDLMRRLLENYRLTSTATVVDSDPRRSTHLEREGVAVCQPKDCREHIARSDLLAIFAPRYKTEILEWVTRETGKSFRAEEVVVIGSGPCGETLT